MKGYRLQDSRLNMPACRLPDGRGCWWLTLSLLKFCGGNLHSRMIKKVFVVFLPLFFLICSNVYPFQYEDYQWGKPLNEVAKELDNKRKPFSFTEDGLMYNERIFDEPCVVFLYFTPKSKELALIFLSWDKTSLGEEIKGSLVKKYGNFTTIDTNIYIWSVPNKDIKKDISDSIYLNYAFGSVRLVYFGGEYYDKFTEEVRSIAENK